MNDFSLKSWDRAKTIEFTGKKFKSNVICEEDTYIDIYVFWQAEMQIPKYNVILVLVFQCLC